MRHISQGTRSLSLICTLHWDWILFPSAIAVALGVGAFIASV